MIFHIIYTPNSVKYFTPFTKEINRYLAQHLCLISNGCQIKERVILQKIALQQQNLSYYCYPTNLSQIHGKVLTHLQARCQQKYFCFMDSDIFATDALPDLIEMMERENLTALFSAMPLWVKKSEYIFKPTFKNMVGTFNQAENGDCLGSTYFAIYRNDHLEQIMQHYGACFDECSRSQLSPQIQKVLADMGYQQQSFDTGKVINLLLLKHGFKPKNIELPQLCHIGGTSYETTYQSQTPTYKQQLKEYLHQTPIKPFIQKYANYRVEKEFKKRYKNTPKEEYQINYNQRILHRNFTRKHFLKLFQALVNQEVLPPPPIFADKEITNNVQQAHISYIANFKKYYDHNQ